MTDKILIGLDEVGWGCIAGPIVVCAAAIPNPEHWDLVRSWDVRDSKKIGNSTHSKATDPERVQYTDGKVTRMAALLHTEGKSITSWALAQMEPVEIDVLGPMRAKNRAFRMAVMALLHQNSWRLSQVRVVVDGNQLVSLLPEGLEQEAIPKADDTILPVSVASIIAKAHRDSIMTSLAPLFPDYHYEQHKGYPTPKHIQQVFSQGPVPGLYRTEALKNTMRGYYVSLSPREREREKPRWLTETGWLEAVKEKVRATPKKPGPKPGRKRAG